MTHPKTANDRIDGGKDERTRTVRRVGLRTEAVAGLAAALLTLIGLDLHMGHAHAQGEGPSGRSERPDEPPRSEFIRGIRRELKTIDQRLTTLNRHVLEHRDSVDNAGDQLANQRITTKSAEANYLNSKLTREVAEIVVREYVEGILVQDEASVEVEIRLAESDLGRARDKVAFVGRREDEHWTRLNEKRASLDLEVARARKKTLVEYTKSRSIKDLEADVAQARVDELVKKEAWEIEKRKEERFEKTVAAERSRALVEHRGLDLLRRATSVEEQVQSKLGKFVNAEKSDEPLQKEIRELTNQLKTIVDEAAGVIAADDFAELKPRIRDAARRAGVGERK